MPKGAKKSGPSTSKSSGSATPNTRSKSDGPPKNTTKKKSGGGGGANKKQKLSKKELKELEKQQRQKAYVAPTKPQPVKPDPLDSTGLAYVLPPELVIVLRNLGKKAVKTREKALDELDNSWLNRREDDQVQILVDMLPVWLSHLPQLLLHASRRIRLAAASVHRSFIGIPAVLDQIRLETQSNINLEAADVLGIWALAVHDIDPTVANVASESWNRFIQTTPSRSQITSITTFAQRAILDPTELYTYLNPPPPPPPAHTPTPHLSSRGKASVNQKATKGKQPPNKGKPSANISVVSSPLEMRTDADEAQSDSLETDADRDARIRVGGLGALAWMLSRIEPSNGVADELLVSLVEPKLWSSLIGNSPESFGFEQPPVRKAAWRLVGAVGSILDALKSAAALPGTDSGRVSDLLHILSTFVLHSAWDELDTGVQGIMWQPLLRFLKENPEAWQWEIEYTASHSQPESSNLNDTDSDSDFGDSDSGSDSDEGEGEADTSASAPDTSRQAVSSAYQSFLSFLERGCNGSPVQAYPAVVVVLSTLPSSILLSTTAVPEPSEPSPPPFSSLFDAFWAALDPQPADNSKLTPNRVFSGPGGDRAAKAFVEAILECVVFLVRRVRSSHSPETHAILPDALANLVRIQIERVWAEVTTIATGEAKQKLRRLRIAPDVVGSAFGRALRGLKGLPEVEGSSSLHDDIWQSVAQLIKENALSAAGAAENSKELSSLVSSVLHALRTDSSDASLSHLLLLDVFSITLDRCVQAVVDAESPATGSLGALSLLTELLRTFGFDLEGNVSISAAGDIDVITKIDTFVVQNVFKLLLLCSQSQSQQGEEGLSLLAVYLVQREASQGSLLWISLLEQVVDDLHSHSSDVATVLGRLLALLDLICSRRGGRGVMERLKPATNDLDEILFGLAEGAVSTPSSSSSTVLTQLRKLLSLSHTAGGLSHPLLTTSGLVRLVDMLIDRFGEGTESLLGIGGFEADDEYLTGLDKLDRLLVLIEVVLESPVFLQPLSDSNVPTSSSSSTLPPTTKIPPSVFLLAHILPRSSLLFEAKSEDAGNLVQRIESVSTQALRIWTASTKTRASNNTELMSVVYSTIISKLRVLLANTGSASRCSAEDVVEAFDALRGSMKSLGSPRSMNNPIEALLPSQASLDTLLDGLNGAPIDGSLGVVDELAGYASLFSSSAAPLASNGNPQIYARYVLALLRIIFDDLGLARKLFADGTGAAPSNSWWILRHLLALGVYAEGVTMVPAAYTSSPLFGDDDTPDRSRRCREIVSKVQQIVAYVFASAEGAGAGEWRKDLCRTLSARNTNISNPSLPSIATFIFSIIRSATQTDSYRDCRIVREVLFRIFETGIGGESISEEEASLWIQYARTISEPEKSARAPLTGITILSTLVANLPSSLSSSFPRLDRYRNELASSLLGVPLSRATSEGLRILLKLVVGTAPDVESEVEFLPVQRAVNVMKACQKWVEGGAEDDDEEDESDGDSMEELESAMSLTFFHFAPILQNVPGSHWQFIFDVLENNIENCEIKFNSPRPRLNPSSLQLVTLARTLRLIGHIQDLASTNKSLRAEWAERRDGVMKGVRDLLLGDGTDEEVSVEASSDMGSWSIPENVCRKLVLELVANYLPDELVDNESLPKMCHLLSYGPSSASFSPSSITSLFSSATISPLVQHHQLAYQILQKAALKRTEHFVMEAGLDTEGIFKAKLPDELMVLLSRTINLDLDYDDVSADREHEQNVFVYLLGWMLLFDLFADTSMKVRMSYIEQLRSSGVIERHFIPNIFGLLGIDRGIVKAFKLDIWGVDKFYVQFYETGSLCGVQTFAAHLYYRALLTVPSLIYTWVLDCRDRQLSSAVATYTSSHFSPVLIRTELDHVKSPEAQSELSTDENQLTVKVASGAVNEVTASYLVDEQQLEIRLRIPGDWPLHRIEIRDTKKIGVDDNRWRSWILAVQQTIWAQNGRIVDGLALFKKNVTGHFAGQVECAICYSLISVMDGSLPKKPCNTCKNRFHAACLFKWFNTSHSSSCPLCRSDILH
ncbi:hypothetical protein GYMLUDRAFT_45278 [Collybiopsis luxurians FD-317 M1]|uniref:E3 ubiquitin-protein ligase listerin n=1 Tax=Collybiopsis luxurians FD-317 M1 TaxID=944289 RepID=A0A0D0C794_9AGAR|nr:hypothetical protein GYMLUDRAFT_45278 [Collybiopsis luxurians FD-317 M1]